MPLQRYLWHLKKYIGAYSGNEFCYEWCAIGPRLGRAYVRVSKGQRRMCHVTTIYVYYL
jgi:hypothetical protein